MIALVGTVGLSLEGYRTDRNFIRIVWASVDTRFLQLCLSCLVSSS